LDFCGIYSGKDINKIKELNLKVQASKIVNAPYLAESSLIIECELSVSHKIGVHTSIVGAIRNVLADEEIISDGVPDIEKLRPVIYAPKAAKYYGVGECLGHAISIQTLQILYPF